MVNSLMLSSSFTPFVYTQRMSIIKQFLNNYKAFSKINRNCFLNFRFTYLEKNSKDVTDLYLKKN